VSNRVRHDAMGPANLNQADLDSHPSFARVPYAALTAVFEAIDATTKRLEISAYLTQFLVDVIDKTPGDLLHVVYLCINRVGRSDSAGVYASGRC
jgi:hypothetical protein